jgi:anthranilate phosphoribosyltransferase
MSPQTVLKLLIEKHDLSSDEMRETMQQVMGGLLTPIQIAGIIVALRAKRETVTELVAAAQVMRSLATKVPVDGDDALVDTCGTGGDGANTFNISTTSAIVAAAAGVKIAKHGGRSVSSACGSADVMQALGVNIDLTPQQVANCVRTIGVGFMFSPNHHSTMKYAASARREIGVRTIFNILGPLTNPAGAKNQVLGVFSRDLLATFAHVLKALGSRRVLVVHAADGLDEISLAGETFVAELRDGVVSQFSLHPDEFGLSPCLSAALAVEDIAGAKTMMMAVLNNMSGPAKDIVILNAGAAIYVANLACNLHEGVQKARISVESGAAREKLETLIEFTTQIAAPARTKSWIPTGKVKHPQPLETKPKAKNNLP